MVERGRSPLRHLTDVRIERNKRNGLKQNQHLYLARRRKEDMKAIELPMKAPEGRPKGSGTAQQRSREGHVLRELIYT